MMNFVFKTRSCASKLMDFADYDGPDAGAYREGDLKLIIGAMSPDCYDTNYPLEPSKHCTPGKPDPHPRRLALHAVHV